MAAYWILWILGYYWDIGYWIARICTDGTVGVWLIGWTGLDWVGLAPFSIFHFPFAFTFTMLLGLGLGALLIL